MICEIAEGIESREHGDESCETADEEESAEVAFFIRGSDAAVEFGGYAAEPADCAHGGSEFDVLGAEAGDEGGGHFLHGGFGLVVDG